MPLSDHEGKRTLIAALYVADNGPYINLPNIDPWTETRDARSYNGPHRVIAHPPCQRWCRYWNGGPSAKVKRLKGDDLGCFDRALWAVRNFGGVLEHPEASSAWPYYGLAKPPQKGGWIEADSFGGFTCCVAQGHYGHKAQKLTWLYVCKVKTPELKWGLCPNMMRMDLDFHSKEERSRAIKTGICQRLSKRQRSITPIPFRDILINIAEGLAPTTCRLSSS